MPREQISGNSVKNTRARSLTVWMQFSSNTLRIDQDQGIGRFTMLKIHAKNLDSFTVLSLQGQIVTGDTDSLRTAVQTLPLKRAVILDLARVTTVDAHGLGVLLQLREWANERSMHFELRNVRKHLMRIFEITRLDTVFHITSSVEFFPSVAEHRASLVALKSCA